MNELLSLNWPPGTYEKTPIRTKRINETLGGTTLLLITDHESLQRDPLREYGHLEAVLKSIEKEEGWKE